MLPEGLYVGPFAEVASSDGPLYAEPAAPGDAALRLFLTNVTARGEGEAERFETISESTLSKPE